ncbi:MAG: ACT domain-containing protein [Candidatus Odinarchaeum yellowstonii]|uniref:ACT domain-containing protein n=1 Tax=Odinarchaeota yellowstonii (strain LCB_4) TaxID=1841599 RepID=A0AAF0IB82_ODILC|nr:MAG: ACT domain-containing protein [Candidatus Odinarchaeum yellowstonii]
MSDEKIVITVVGVDRPGIVAMVANILAENNINIEDMRSTILQSGIPVFTMIMIADMSKSKISYDELKNILKKKEEETGVKLIALKEEIFKFLHRV